MSARSAASESIRSSSSRPSCSCAASDSSAASPEIASSSVRTMAVTIPPRGRMRDEARESKAPCLDFGLSMRRRWNADAYLHSPSLSALFQHQRKDGISVKLKSYRYYYRCTLQKGGVGQYDDRDDLAPGVRAWLQAGAFCPADPQGSGLAWSAPHLPPSFPLSVCQSRPCTATCRSSRAITMS